jgi:PAS domain S-box-containing protein
MGSVILKHSVELTFKDSIKVLQAMLDSLPDHIALLDNNGTIIAVNEAWVLYAQENALDHELFGVGDNYIDVCRRCAEDDPDAKAVMIALEELLHEDTSRPYHRDYMCPHPIYPSLDRWFHLCMMPLALDWGRGIVVSHHDVSARIVTERSRYSLEQAIAQTRTAIMITRVNGDIEYVNNAFSEITGYSAHEAIGNNPRLLKSGKNSGSAYAEMWRTLLSGMPWRGHVCNRRKNGQLYWDDMTISPIKDPAGVVTHYIAVKEDVTESHQHALLNAAVITATVDAFVVLDALGNITDWSPQAETIFGLSGKEAIGKDFINTLMVPGLIPDALYLFAHFKASFGSRLGHHKRRTQMHRHDGQVLFVELWLTALDLPKEVRYIVLIRDVTEAAQKEHELQIAKKMEAVGLMTSGLVHDFNNFIQIISGSLGLAAMTDLPLTAGKYVNLALDAAKRSAEITKSLLAFARHEPIRKVATDINRLLENMVPIIEHSAGKDITVLMSANARKSVVAVNVSGFNNAILNLVINARDAMPRGGRLHLYSYSQSIAYTNPLQNFNLSEGDYLVVGIDDSGEGMSPEVASRAFDPFFSTKEPGEGTGLGLAMVRSFCQQQGGAAQIHSQKGLGTSIQLILPTVMDNSTRVLQS